ncbi:hypothetical protein [Vagococcus intermedius]|uniref:Uncharacterized protein n=1 Tax=Vagococcus intermedius TaxID=2991418 RepID=A0AAF0CVL7_9ENTE|nr:hypothetical protein [Vagococcus intermedius]WEG73805.1 hypothetical protein OL234_02520 [Vagococcus intermedius]WEG75890.1 hypothetical protein OL235_02530 [Vagococcus intermedius]
MKLNKKELSFFTENQKMIHSILKRCHIYPYSPDYEDFVQIGRLLFLQILEKTAVLSLDNLPLAKRPSYIYQQLYWRLRDEQRRYLRYKTKIEPRDVALDLESPLLNPQIDFSETLNAKEILLELLPLLTSAERLLLLTLIHHPTSLNDYAKKNQLPRSSVYRYRKNIQKKFLALIHKN